MNLTSFEYSRQQFMEWCTNQDDVELITDLSQQENELEALLDKCGIDAIIKHKGKIKTVQYRCRRARKACYNDVTVRRYNIGRKEDRAYKLRNVAYFIYITPEWWAILDTIFYDKVDSQIIHENTDGSDFYCYSINDLLPYVVWSHNFAKVGDIEK